MPERADLSRSAKAALGPALPFVGRNQLLVGENGGLKDIGAYDPAGVAESLLRDSFLIDSDSCHNLPLLACRIGIFARTSLARILRMRHQFMANVKPYGSPFQFPLCRNVSVGFTGKTSVP